MHGMICLHSLENGVLIDALLIASFPMWIENTSNVGEHWTEQNTFAIKKTCTDL